MGLLAKISAGDFPQSRPLCFSKANFCTFLEEHKIEFLSFLCPVSQNYFCTQSFGFDINSIISTFSTKTFWDGFFETNTESIVNLNKDDGSLIQLLQFFSESQKDLIQSASIHRFSDGTILTVFNKELNQKLIDDFISLKEDIPLSTGQKILQSGEFTSSFSIDFTECKENFIAIAKKQGLSETDNFIKAFMAEIYERLYFYFSAPNFIYRVFENTVNVKMTSQNKLPKELIFRHIVKSFSDFLGTSSELIQIDFGE